MFSLKKLSPTITDMIRFDHSHVLVSFHQYTADAKPKVKKALAETIASALEIHATLEEELFYPAVRNIDSGEPVLLKSVPEHNEMRRLIGELRATAPTDVRHDQLVQQLMRDVIHHVADEETVLLPQAERLLSKDRLSELGADMTRRRIELAGPKAGKLALDTAVGFSGSTAAWTLGIVGALAAATLLSRKAKPA
ncbi:hemerythrin domain-containing protein [Pseudoduganella sp. FT55W]|uniref:Hemerythrin domain-containing protein n=1 Tax=Duganella rivi TaxID=2666083 RepID=A0A7X4GSC9_9BURK|nr:hemerythrin domain-containing protein [Duganella rivi]MYM68758.1 hemerythrin domain-containing protein [Duganella rivi]